MSHTLVILAAGLSTRYGGSKQLAAVGPSGEILLDYAVHDAVKAGFEQVTFVIRRELEKEFRSHAESVFGTRLTVTFSYQEGRKKPWGTAHAILSTRDQVSGPFVVINADDFYGASAYTLMNDFFVSTGGSDGTELAMVGYPLGETFSPHGGVSRGICECDDRGFVQRIVEVKQIERRDTSVEGVTVEGNPYALHGDETVSMNIWALTPAVFPILDRQFKEFVRKHGQNPDAEFLISTALNEQVASGESRLRLFQTGDRWFGMTFQDDKPVVQREIAALVEQGKYPAELASWFHDYK